MRIVVRTVIARVVTFESYANGVMSSGELIVMMMMMMAVTIVESNCVDICF